MVLYQKEKAFDKYFECIIATK